MPQGLAGLTVNPEELAKLPVEEQEAIKAELAELERKYKANPLLGYTPHPKQVVFHSPPHPRVRAFFGGNRSGKTTAAVVDTIIQAIDREMVPGPLQAFKTWEPPFLCRVMTPDLTGTMDGAVHDKIREWCPPAQLKGGNFDRAFDKQLRKLHFKNGSTIQFNSSEQEREKLGGIPLHRVVYDEEPQEDKREECMWRLIDYDGDEIFALTPFEGMGWLFDEFYEPWERGVLDPDEARVVVVDLDDNPYLSKTGKARVLAKAKGPGKQARKSGRFISFAGLIYSQWSVDTHVIPEIDRVPPNVEVFRGIDPGYRHLHAVLYAYLTTDDELIVFDEIGLQQATVADVCKHMRLRDVKWGIEDDSGNKFPLRPNWTVIDPASRNKNNQTGRSDQQEFADHGVYTIPAQNDVTAGINRVKERLDAKKLFVTANCEGLIGEFRRYRWVKNTGRGENEAREAPVKKDDHRLDTLRYIVMQRPLAPSPEKQSEHLSGPQRMLRDHLKRLRRPKAVDPGSGFGPGQYA